MREGRGGRRLEIDGTFASLWRPGRSTTGSVWDALAVPVLGLPRSRRRSALLLGLGGGSAVRLLRALVPEIRVVGIEIDPEVVRAARRWFGLGRLGIEVRCGDARTYLARARRRFDLVLDDVFVGRGRGVRKPAWMLEEGWERAVRRVAPGGMLVTNVLDEGEAARRTLREHFPCVVEIGVDGYDNRILVGGPAPLSGRSLRRAARDHAPLAESLARLRFRTVS